MVKKFKQFMLSRAMIRFYRIVGFGVLSALLVGFLELVPQVALPDQVAGGLVLILTGILAAVDKKLRELKSNK